MIPKVILNHHNVDKYLQLTHHRNPEHEAPSLAKKSKAVLLPEPIPPVKATLITLILAYREIKTVVVSTQYGQKRPCYNNKKI